MKLILKALVCVIPSCMASGLFAWEFTPGTPCRLTHQSADVAVELTYDPSAPIYSIALTHAAGLPAAPVFSMRFDGAMPIEIATDRHQITDNGQTVSVSDSGFGNVLNGLQFNKTATATLGAETLSFSLKGAAEPVAAFRACDAIATS